jgi:hypothetical protein
MGWRIPRFSRVCIFHGYIVSLEHPAAVRELHGGVFGVLVSLLQRRAVVIESLGGRDLACLHVNEGAGISDQGRRRAMVRFTLSSARGVVWLAGARAVAIPRGSHLHAHSFFPIRPHLINPPKQAHLLDRLRCVFSRRGLYKRDLILAAVLLHGQDRFSRVAHA